MSSHPLDVSGPPASKQKRSVDFVLVLGIFKLLLRFVVTLRFLTNLFVEVVLDISDLFFLFFQL